jgi:hypothetical protein
MFSFPRTVLGLKQSTEPAQVRSLWSHNPVRLVTVRPRVSGCSAVYRVFGVGPLKLRIVCLSYRPLGENRSQNRMANSVRASGKEAVRVSLPRDRYSRSTGDAEHT